MNRLYRWTQRIQKAEDKAIAKLGLTHQQLSQRPHSYPSGGWTYDTCLSLVSHFSNKEILFTYLVISTARLTYTHDFCEAIYTEYNNRIIEYTILRSSTDST